MAKPVLLVTRKLPDAIEARAARDYDARLNPQDEPWFRDGAEIARRATAVGRGRHALRRRRPAGRRLTIAALPASVRIIATFSVGTDHIDARGREGARHRRDQHARGAVLRHRRDRLHPAC